MSPVRTSTHCDKGRASQSKRKENTSIWIGKKEIKYHLYRKYSLNIIYNDIARTNEWIEQHNSIQDQHTHFNRISA